ncbi:hypothetical protein O6H91_09G076900 [Diphasiastrum complanatum]|uniref:Uncharacterized protein n=1 Tax=Diphasiastrum complanatum TaxID=34168 RepID=A0ACC2CR44_DIPCM|nr:hypothetical protein O6H91_09G076900 [Diphasiastrum complanatum]
MTKNMSVNLQETETQLRLGPPEAMNKGGDGICFQPKQELYVSRVNTGNEGFLVATCENKCGRTLFCEQIKQTHDCELNQDGLNLKIGISSESAREAHPIEELAENKPWSFGRAFNVMPIKPKNAMTGSKRVFSEVTGSAALVTAKLPNSTACGIEARAPKQYTWSPVATQPHISWKIGVGKPGRPAACDPLLSPRKIFMNGDIRDQYGSKILPKKPSLLHTASPSDPNLQQAKATPADVATNDTATRGPVGWPPVQSFRRNSLPTPKPKVHGESEREAVAAVPSRGPKGQATQADCLFVKVYMDGLSIGRKVDIKTYDGYEDLSLALEELFKRFCNGQACTQDPAVVDDEVSVRGRKKNFFCVSDYVLAYEDKDGDLMLVGDVPWGMFTATVKRLRIMKGSAAIGLGSTEVGQT